MAHVSQGVTYNVSFINHSLPPHNLEYHGEFFSSKLLNSSKKQGIWAKFCKALVTVARRYLECIIDRKIFMSSQTGVL